jgi:hypothetical protein
LVKEKKSPVARPQEYSLPPQKLGRVPVWHTAAQLELVSRWGGACGRPAPCRRWRPPSRGEAATRRAVELVAVEDHNEAGPTRRGRDDESDGRPTAHAWMGPSLHCLPCPCLWISSLQSSREFWRPRPPPLDPPPPVVLSLPPYLITAPVPLTASSPIPQPNTND